MDRLSLLLPRVLGRRGLRQHAQAAQAVHAVNDWLVRELGSLSQAARAVSLKNGDLLIHCDHSVAAQECQAAAAQLLSFLGKEMPNIHISAIRVMRSTGSVVIIETCQDDKTSLDSPPAC